MNKMMREPLYFWGHTKRSGDKKCLSNWYSSRFKDEEDNEYVNSEQYMMYHKAQLFGDDQIAGEILQTSDPKLVKQLGRKVKNFDKKVWSENAREIVYQGCLLKFSQNAEIKKFLLSTGDRLLVEASPYDTIWGIGMSEKEAKNIPIKKWKGSNWLGECLVRVRKTILEEINDDKSLSIIR